MMEDYDAMFADLLGEFSPTGESSHYDSPHDSDTLSPGSSSLRSIDDDEWLKSANTQSDVLSETRYCIVQH